MADYTTSEMMVSRAAQELKDGDVVFALSTHTDPDPSIPPATVMALGVVARDVLESAITGAVREG